MIFLIFIPSGYKNVMAEKEHAAPKAAEEVVLPRSFAVASLAQQKDTSTTTTAIKKTEAPGSSPTPATTFTQAKGTIPGPASAPTSAPAPAPTPAPAPELAPAPVAPAHAELAPGRVAGRVKWFNVTKGFGFIAPSEASGERCTHVRV